MLIQIVLSLVLLFALVMTWRRAAQQAIRSLAAVAWSAVWFVAAFFIWQPDASTKIAHFVGVGRGADLILYTSIIVLLLLVFRLHVVHDKLEKALTELVRREAMREEG